MSRSLLFFLLILSTPSQAACIGRNAEKHECKLFGFSLLIDSWKCLRGSTANAYRLRDELSDCSSVSSECFDGYEADIEDDFTIKRINAPINLNQLYDNPRVLDKIMIRFYDLVISEQINTKDEFFMFVEDPLVYFDATKEMYFACLSYTYEDKTYKGVSYKTILKKVAKVIEDPFHDFAYFARHKL